MKNAQFLLNLDQRCILPTTIQWYILPSILLLLHKVMVENDHFDRIFAIIVAAQIKD